ncbi:amylo-alpha-1,6-glucosidase [Lacrimispora brassicae]
MEECSMELDIRSVPFSRYGSYLAFSYPQDGTKEFDSHIGVRVLYGAFSQQETYPIILIDNEGKPEEKISVSMSPWELNVTSKTGGYSICFGDEDTFLLKANSPVLITKTKAGSYDRVMEHMDGSFEIAGDDMALQVSVQKGNARNQWACPDNGYGSSRTGLLLSPVEGELLVQVALIGLSPQKKEYESYDLCRQAVKEEYEEFEAKIMKSLKKADPAYEKAGREAAYILWHSVLHPSGYIKRPVMVMTKNWMNLVWSWDYAFNALALVSSHPDLAYGQFLAMADQQDEYGAYPDAYQARKIIRSFVKPPVQGFILEKMFQIHDPGREVKEKLYRSTDAFTLWWLNYRMEENGIPTYHHGNDSGWDNATVFRMGLPVQSPDLSAWLVLQMEFLEHTARDLGRLQEAEKWKEQGEDLLSKLLAYFVRDGRFEAVKIPEMEVVPSDSLILYLPLILGKRLPEKLRESLILGLLKKGHLAGSWGFASEPLDSMLFEEDGYWRGAVWPPVTMILVDALRQCGRGEEARFYAERFSRLCAEKGFYENYSALDGRGLRDHGFTWTASVFLILLRDYLMD